MDWIVLAPRKGFTMLSFIAKMPVTSIPSSECWNKFFFEMKHQPPTVLQKVDYFLRYRQAVLLNDRLSVA